MTMNDDDALPALPADADAHRLASVPKNLTPPEPPQSRMVRDCRVIPEHTVLGMGATNLITETDDMLADPRFLSEREVAFMRYIRHRCVTKDPWAPDGKAVMMTGKQWRRWRDCNRRYWRSLTRHLWLARGGSGSSTPPAASAPLNDNRPAIPVLPEVVRARRHVLHID